MKKIKPEIKNNLPTNSHLFFEISLSEGIVFINPRKLK